MVDRSRPYFPLLENVNGASGPGSAGQAVISGQQFTAQCFGERDVDGVVHRHIRAQLVSAAHEPERGVPVDIELPEIVNCCGKPFIGHRAGDPSLAQHGDRFDVREIGRGHVAAIPEGHAGSVPVGPVIADDIGQD